MQTINLKCDRCGNSETVDSIHQSKLKLCKVGFTVDDGSCVYFASVPSVRVANSADWCEKCRIEMGLMYRSKEEEEKKPDPTLEEQLVELLRCFVQNNVPQQQ